MCDAHVRIKRGCVLFIWWLVYYEGIAMLMNEECAHFINLLINLLREFCNAYVRSKRVHVVSLGTNLLRVVAMTM